jgi:hypothetical protein
MPPPAPFNLMPIVTDTLPFSSGECHVTATGATFPYFRPVANQRLAMGRTIDASTRHWGANISRFHRGILTVGGTGGSATSTAQPAPPGGNGGSITVQNSSNGRIRFLNSVELITGAGSEELASVIFVVNGCGDFKFFDHPAGGLGGRGALNGGRGGIGGKAGDITISGILFPATTVAAPGSPSRTDLFGFDGDSPVASGGQKIGEFLRFATEGFSTDSSPGSGGAPGGSGTSFPGFFGAKGTAGATTINGTTFFH